MTQSQERPQRQRRKDRILGTAMRMFAEQDFEDVSIDDLCREADVAKGLIFYHFQDKRGLYAAALQHVWREYVYYQQPGPGEDTPVARVYSHLRRHFEFVERNPKLFAMLMRDDHASAEGREILRAQRNRAGAIVASDLGCPINPPPRLRQAIYAWNGMVDSVTEDWLTHRDTHIDDLVDLCVQSLVAVVRAASDRYFDFDSEVTALAHVATAPKPESAARSEDSSNAKPSSDTAVSHSEEQTILS